MINALESPVLLSIAGPTCSGKSFLAKRLPLWLPFGLSSVLVPQDCFYKDLGDPTIPCDANGLADFDRPDSYRNDVFIQAASDLLQGKASWLPLYNLDDNSVIRDNGSLLQPAPLVTGEGLFAIDALQGIWIRTIRVFIMIGEDTALERRIKRDTKLYDIPADQVRKFFYRHVWPRQLEFVFQQSQTADLVIRGEDGEDL